MSILFQSQRRAALVVVDLHASVAGVAVAAASAVSVTGGTTTTTARSRTSHVRHGSSCSLSSSSSSSSNHQGKRFVHTAAAATAARFDLAGTSTTIFGTPSSARYLSLETAAAKSLKKQPQPPQLELYQYEICPFCNKTKAFLMYSGISYQSIEVNPLTKNEIKWSKEYRKVPMARLLWNRNNSDDDDDDDNKDDDDDDDDAVVAVYKGSDDIVKGLLEQDWVIRALEEQWNNNYNAEQQQTTKMTLHEFAHSESAHQWVDYTNNELAVLLYPNLCPTLQDSYRAFQYVDRVPTFSPWQRWSIRAVGSLAMYMAASRVQKKHNITNAREALDKALQKPIQALLQQQLLFLSGNALEPNVGDLAVYGALRGLEGTRLHTEIMEPSPVPFQAWYQRVRAKVEEKKS